MSQAIKPQSRHYKFNTWFAYIATTITILIAGLRLRDIAAGGGGAWQTGDWLLNYSAGFIRRGMTGEIIFFISPTGELAVTIVTVTQFVLIATIQVSALILFLRTPRTPIWLMIVFSPAAGLFGFLNPDAFMRKEIIPIAAIALMAIIFRAKLTPWFYTIPLLLLALGSFSHETSNFAVPAFLYLIFLEFKRHRFDSKTFGILVSLVVIPAALGLGLTVFSPGTSDQVTELCSFFTDRDLEQMCAGPLTYLDDSLIDGMNQVSAWFPNYLTYIPAIVLAALPIALLRPQRSIWVLLLVTYIFLTPLFLSGIDYGRWIFLATSLITFVLLGTSNQIQRNPVDVPLYAAILFIVLWLMPYTADLDYRSLLYFILDDPVSWTIDFLAQALNPTK